MAIVEKKFYGMRCDGCGKMLSSDEFGDEYQDNQRWLEQVAEDSEWKLVRDKHYCPDCYHYGDNDDLIFADGTVIHSYEDDWE